MIGSEAGSDGIEFNPIAQAMAIELLSRESVVWLAQTNSKAQVHFPSSRISNQAKLAGAPRLGRLMQPGFSQVTPFSARREGT